MHQVIDSPDELIDLWLLHDEGDKRHVMMALTFCYYALSPSTKEVVLFPDPLKAWEIRAYGPEGQIVSYDIPTWRADLAHSLIGGLCAEMERAGKLVFA